MMDHPLCEVPEIFELVHDDLVRKISDPLKYLADIIDTLEAA